ncbi:MFS transporter [Dactylosporangium aurantiacum]|uniref:MFS transporter n=1 Tax=Dactylosporangium aurantiacum TaxID=35754 RepID=A0A9Q9MM20_9ACTN|nr:MFS transporter [Dactylosporangium aurantiacum]
MSVIRGVAQTVVTTVRAARVATVGGARAGRFVGRNLLRVRERGAGGETGMLRLLDLHAASCAGDTLVALGLAGTIFFSVPAGEARDRVALYLIVTMLPFALLAPIVGPVLDRFRHGRRYALATTMLGRAFLAVLISEHLTGWALYPAAFGMLVLSRAYGVARSAAVPRVLPKGLGLSEAGARASVFGTFAGAIVLPIGLAAAHFGPQWPLRLSVVVFFYGMVTSLRLPPRADSDPPEQVPRVLQRPSHRGAKVLSGRLVVGALIGSATLRALYGFLTLFLAFAIKEKALPVGLGPWQLSEQVAVVVVAAALGVGSFLATAIGTRLRIHRPALLQAVGIVLVTLVALIAADRGSLGTVALLCLVTAVASGLAKLAVDASIQERADEQVRASAFAHSETLLMVAWVVGGAAGLIPFGPDWGLIVAAVFMALGAARAVWSAVTLRKERLRGAPLDDSEQPTDPVAATSAAGAPGGPAGGGFDPRRAGGGSASGGFSGGSAGRASGSGPAGGARGRGGDDATTVPRPAGAAGPRPTAGAATAGAAAGAAQGGAGATRRMPSQSRSGDESPAADQGSGGDGSRRRFGWRRRRPATVPTGSTAPNGSSGPAGAGGGQPVDATRQMPAVDVDETTPLAPPGYTLYRPSGMDSTRRLEDDER